MNASRDGADSPNRLRQLVREGQSVWLDYLRRDLVSSGELDGLVERDGLTGLTSNPSIFEKSIAGSALYDADIAHFLAQDGGDPGKLYERLAITDIRAAADVLRPVYERGARHDGYVSLEVSPYLAMDTAGTIDEARRLWRAVERPNVMIKVPGTGPGIPAVRQLTAEGINVNVTLLFSRAAYEAVVEAFVSGLERASGDLSRIASVASFFVSRIDTEVDRAIEQRMAGLAPGERAALERLQGKIGIANAKLAYRSWKLLFSTARWQRLAALGGRPQRLLWASTGTKNKAYSDVLYVENLIGPDTVNTMPPGTLDAFRDHGKSADTLEANAEEAEAQLAALERFGISLPRITDALLVQGVERFAEDFDGLLAGVARKRTAALGSALLTSTVRLPQAASADVDQALDAWRAAGNVRRLWAGDRSLWTSSDEDRWLGWLDIVDRELEDHAWTRALVEDVSALGICDVVLLGMGGSSLGPQVLADTLGESAPNSTSATRVSSPVPRFRMLDSTDPAQVAAVEKGLDWGRSLIIVSSKSGTTLEPNVFMQYFFHRAEEALGAHAAGERFVAITDPGSSMERVARERGFHTIFYGVPAIGGRYSVLSKFGLVPAAAIGLPVERLLRSARQMVQSCAASVPPAENPGVRLGAALATLARGGRDKITVLAGPGVESAGAWLEQLIAESTGKQGHGLIPVDDEPIGATGAYGADRVFAFIRLSAQPDAGLDATAAALAAAGHPVLDFVLHEPAQVTQLFYVWEMAIAAVGAMLHLNPFDQPDVEASKMKTRSLTAAFEQSGQLPAAEPFYRDGGVSLYADPSNRGALAGADSLAGLLRAHLGRSRRGDYVALLAYIERNAEHIQSLRSMRRSIRDRLRVATCGGFGPRFLHSTGQAYKGGPNSGVFLQITCADRADLPVPGQRYSFGVVKAAQAQGDLEVLTERGRRALRVHLDDVDAGLAKLASAIEQALSGLEPVR